MVQFFVGILASPRVASVCHTWPERSSGRVAHVVHTWPLQAWPFGRATSRAPLAFFSRIRASELRIRIRFRITNRDSLTHDDNYETLKNG